jgi:hypothetical protein
MPRNTKTGGVLEAMVLPALARGVLAQQGNIQYLISLKWQQSSGTAEHKIPFEVLCLVDAVQINPELYKRAYLVLGGTGWTLREFYTMGGLGKYMKYDSYVSILSLESFVALANKSYL